MREAGMPEKQADALAGALVQGMGETFVTCDVLSSTISDFKADMAQFKAEMRADMAEFKAEIRTEMAQLATTLTNRMYGIAVGIVTATGLIQYFAK
jgi:hypothetical protein